VYGFGSTGHLYTQITRGARHSTFPGQPPEKAVKGGYAVPDSRFAYATGRIVKRRRTLIPDPLCAFAYTRC
jgi:molybdate transport system substrate-binding protein